MISIAGRERRGGVPIHSVLLHEIDQAGAAQQRSEIPNLAVDRLCLVVKGREKRGERHALAMRDLLENAPELCFQLDRGRESVEPDRSGHIAVGLGQLACEDPAHGCPPSGLAPSLLWRTVEAAPGK